VTSDDLKSLGIDRAWLFEIGKVASDPAWWPFFLYALGLLAAWLLSDYLVTGFQTGRGLLDLKEALAGMGFELVAFNVVIVLLLISLVSSLLVFVATEVWGMGWFSTSLLMLAIDLAVLLRVLAAKDAYRTYAESLTRPQREALAEERRRKEQEREQREQRERRRGTAEVKDLTGWLEETTETLKEQIKDPAVLQDALLELEKRHDEILKQKIKEMQP
jgi:hypothetical protein